MRSLVGLSFLVLVIFMGCNNSGPATAARTQVSGTVLLDGKPMNGGEVRFNLTGQPAQVIEVHEGAFSGEVFVGTNRIDVLWEKDGPPHPMEPNEFLKVNVVSGNFSGPNSPFQHEIGESGANDLKFEVTAARR